MAGWVGGGEAVGVTEGEESILSSPFLALSFDTHLIALKE